MDNTPKKRGAKPVTEKAKEAKASLFKRPAKAVKQHSKPRVVKPKVEQVEVEEIPEPKIEKQTIVEQTVEEPIINPIKENIMNEEFEAPFEYSPIDEPVVERSYNDTTVMSEIGDIPEPDFGDQTPNFDEAEIVEETPEKEPSAFDNISNPAMNELDNKDKKIASEQLVDTVLDGYEMLHQLGAKVSKIDENKVVKRIVSGEIDRELRIPISEDVEVNALEYVQTHNAQADEVFEYDKSFNDKVRPAMVRVFMKRGLGVTDEQFIIGMFVKDIAIKGMMAISMKKNANAMLDYFAQATVQNVQPVQAPSHVYTPDSIQVQPKPEGTVEMKVETAKIPSIEEIEAQMMED